MIGPISGQSVNYQYYAPTVGRNQAGQTGQAEAVQKAGENTAVAAAEQQKQSGVAVPAEPVIKNGTFGKIVPDPAEVAVRMQLEGQDAAAKTGDTVGQEECQTCKERKYQDGSNDPGVSFKSPAHIAPEQAASVVRGHEQEHVVREQAAAARENRKVVSQSVTLHSGICPECGRVYISGGTTRTVTAAESKPEPKEQTDEKENILAPTA